MIHSFRTKCSEDVLKLVDTLVQHVKVTQPWPANTQFYAKLIDDPNVYEYYAVLPNGATLSSPTRWNKEHMATIKDVLFNPTTNEIIVETHLETQRLGQIPVQLVEDDAKWVTISEAKAKLAKLLAKLNASEKSWTLPKIEVE